VAGHRLLIFGLLLLTGCESQGPEPGQEPPVLNPAIGTSFQAANTGRVTGHITWTAPIPNVSPFLYGVPNPSGTGFEFRTAENPNRPLVDPNTRAVEGVVVFLRGIDPATSRQWDLPPVAIEIGNGQIEVVQGNRRGRCGFVRRGDTITVSSTEPVYHLLRGRGDAFFSLALPAPKSPTKRVLSQLGRVELSSGTGLYWARANIFVSDHPYYTVTDKNGEFAFEHVPSGDVEVAVWMPGWQPLRTERDPDSTQVARQAYCPGIKKVAKLKVGLARLATVDFILP